MKKMCESLPEEFSERFFGRSCIFLVGVCIVYIGVAWEDFWWEMKSKWEKWL